MIPNFRVSLYGCMGASIFIFILFLIVFLGGEGRERKRVKK